MARRSVLVVAALSGLLAAGLTAPAESRTDEPPVTVADEVTLLPFGGHADIRLTSNDSDDHDRLALCRVRNSANVEASISEQRASITLWAEDPGDYTVDYQACDTRYLSVGTLTVHAVAPQDVTVEPVNGQAGVLEATNPNPVRVAVLWARPDAEEIEGFLTIPAGASRTFSVAHHHIVWVAFDASTRADDPPPISSGEIRDIPLPATPTAALRTVPTREQRWWASRDAAPRSGRSVAASGGQPWPTDPTTLAPPFSQPDEINLWVGGQTKVRHLLRNDTDPQGQTLDLCRYDDDVLAAPGTPYVQASLQDGKLSVSSHRRVAGKTVVHYYVCNAGRLAPARLVVHLHRAAPLVVHRLGPESRRVRVHNPNGQTTFFAVGKKHPTGIIGQVPGHGTQVFHVSLLRQVWRGYILPSFGFAGSGRIQTG